MYFYISKWYVSGGEQMRVSVWLALVECGLDVVVKSRMMIGYHCRR